MSLRATCTEPLAAGIFTADGSRLSVAAALPQFVEMERRFGSLTRGLAHRARESAGDGRAAGARYGKFLAPREGMIFQNQSWMPLTPQFHELFKINVWEMVMAEPPSREKSHPLSYCSPNLSNNTFSIDPKTICVEAGEFRIMEQLDELGFDVITVEFFEVSPFGGGLHCATVDVNREGGCKDYFPKQIKGF